MYRIHQRRFVVQMLPPHRRQPKRVALFELILSPLVRLYDDFYKVYISLYQDTSLAPQVAVVLYRLNQIAGLEPGTIMVEDSNTDYLTFVCPAGLEINVYFLLQEYLKIIKPYGFPPLNIILL